jgi:hypothetical protein
MGADRGTGQYGSKKSTGVKTWSPTVVATAPTSTVPTTGGAGWGGSADYWERIQEDLITGAGAPSASESRNTPTYDVSQFTLGIPGLEGLTASQISSLFSGGSGSGTSASDKLASEKFAFDKNKWNQEFANTLAQQGVQKGQWEQQQKSEIDRINFERKKQADALNAMLNRYSTGGYRENADKLLELLTQQESTGRSDIQDIYNKAIGNIGAGYNEAARISGLGYTGLEDFINANQVNPYADYKAQIGQVSNPLEAVLGAYGVSSPDVQAQVAAEQFAGQQGAQGFQTLIDILGKSQQQSNLSRLAEAKMARTLGEAGLAAQRAGYQTQAETAQASALSNLLNQIANSRFGVEQSVGQNADALANLIMQYGGTPGQDYVSPQYFGYPYGGQVGDGGVKPEEITPIDLENLDFSGIGNIF